MGTYERALDAAMVVAIGKLLLFSTIWEELETKLSKRSISVKEREMLRRYLKEIISDLDDELFFVDPEKVSSEDDVKKIIAFRIKSRKFADEVTQHLKSRLETGQSQLGKYLR